MPKPPRNVADRLNLEKLYEFKGDGGDTDALSSYRKSLEEEPDRKPEEQIQLASKLKSGKLCGYLNYTNTHEIMNTFHEQYIRLHEQDLEDKQVVKPGFEKDNIPETKKINTKGSGWFNFPENESKEVEQDYLVIQLRNALDPKRFYKKPEHKSKIPKFLQTGTVVTDAHDFYDRATKAERKPTLVEEMLANVESKRKIKKRYRAVLPMVGKKRKIAAIKKRQQKNEKKRKFKGRRK